jgi:hypothetical protein
MSPQERIRAAQDLRKRANSQPGLPQKLRQEARRAAHSLVKLNALEAKRQPK